MHPRKAEVLSAMEITLGKIDRAIQRNVRIVTAPRHHSWGELGIALGTLPMFAVVAALADLSYVRVARSADEAWDRIPPSEPQGE
jgi:hypothetical protein